MTNIIAVANQKVGVGKTTTCANLGKNVERGSGRRGKAEDIKPYSDPVFANNIILTQTERLPMNSRPKDPKTSRNKNVLAGGGSGSGKTRFFIKPNLMQCDSKAIDKPTILCYYIAVVSDTGYKSHRIGKEGFCWKT